MAKLINADDLLEWLNDIYEENCYDDDYSAGGASAIWSVIEHVNSMPPLMRSEVK